MVFFRGCFVLPGNSSNEIMWPVAFTIVYGRRRTTNLTVANATPQTHSVA